MSGKEYVFDMKRSLLDILACPMCKHYPLELTVSREENGEIAEGEIRCTACGVTYPVKDGIPNMLPPDMRSK
jgi:uncharacterized protein YbaR (Trm112 family)